MGEGEHIRKTVGRKREPESSREAWEAFKVKLRLEEAGNKRPWRESDFERSRHPDDLTVDPQEEDVVL